MSEIRKNPLTGDRVILAPKRANRPHSHLTADSGVNTPEYHENCPFCRGNEHLTPREVLFYGKNSSAWDLRVVYNKFPAVDKKNTFSLNRDNPMKIRSYAEGVSEVVIETPHHSKNIAHYTPEEIELIIKAYKERYIAISREKNIKYVSVFKNNGKEAGASISHSHSQIIGIPVVPPLIRREIAAGKKYYKKKSSCFYCDMIAFEKKEKSRIVFENDEYIAFIPYAAKVPFQLNIFPKEHNHAFENITENQIKSLAATLKAVLYKLYEGQKNPPYNYFIKTSPPGAKTEDFYHMYIELIPRNTSPGGFELGTGIFINISEPEENAKVLREIRV